ncbi:hypothetical protein MLAC_25830 [Mycobacterium lacus]|uniref:Uncharacterized protein n=1 Tax=Mycobacterium lacus TaxID=169765 RepID=A0A7I7NLW5_9MYCO|nr:hypothetical protein MLAC_25830 [Mycobacterium lacus]
MIKHPAAIDPIPAANNSKTIRLTVTPCQRIPLSHDPFANTTGSDTRLFGQCTNGTHGGNGFTKPVVMHAVNFCWDPTRGREQHRQSAHRLPPRSTGPQ